MIVLATKIVNDMLNANNKPYRSELGTKGHIFYFPLKKKRHDNESDILNSFVT